MAKRNTQANPLPGEPTHTELIDEMIRVDHAGEYGAQRIYAGQLAVLKNHACAPTLQHMAEQETEHLRTFERLMKARGARPTALVPLWHVLGFAMGAGTAMLGEKAAMACTVAVERVIADHYAEQGAALGEDEQELKHIVQKFREEEIEHHDIGIDHGAEQTPFYEALSAGISGATKLAIFLSKKL
ncbi:MAG: demethoxyubiquinone hydroxylase family protein [Rickettsiales bacterium]